MNKISNRIRTLAQGMALVAVTSLTAGCSCNTPPPADECGSGDDCATGFTCRDNDQGVKQCLPMPCEDDPGCPEGWQCPRCPDGFQCVEDGQSEVCKKDVDTPSMCTLVDDCPDPKKCIPEDPYGTPNCQPLWDGELHQLGEACDTDGAGDSCDRGLICVNEICAALCLDTSQCPAADDFCFKYSGGVGICSQTCDPLDPDSCGGDGLKCGNELGSNTEFICTPDDSGGVGQGTAGASCQTMNQCKPGHVCLPAGTCAALCDVGEDPDPCIDGSCQPFFSDPPQGLEHIGVCISP